eukprot:scaffold304755_cov26-Prasinocladus_malaysianus.AAC.2
MEDAINVDMKQGKNLEKHWETACSNSRIDEPKNKRQKGATSDKVDTVSEPLIPHPLNLHIEAVQAMYTIYQRT